MSLKFKLPNKLVKTFAMGVDTIIFRNSTFLSCLYMTTSRGLGNFRQEQNRKRKGADLRSESELSFIHVAACMKLYKIVSVTNEMDAGWYV